ncbi:Zinc finger domain-containing MYND finger domain [Chlorella sorokiniana]|uniref:phytol kinase n=1 Tax=Chlorella sorokiniana TaxID=3076 RepID=A0A2P6TQ15_CHLSO|nr:Zinc finger domain-containing MYND finger domain [Chlorella sorokiniana]|eukprot:PRW56127.1 Zinc finger domain-containing MYND finger domain [Chlorella sorokiniana]
MASPGLAARLDMVLQQLAAGAGTGQAVVEVLHQAAAVQEATEAWETSTARQEEVEELRSVVEGACNGKPHMAAVLLSGEYLDAFLQEFGQGAPLLSRVLAALSTLTGAAKRALDAADSGCEGGDVQPASTAAAILPMRRALAEVEADMARRNFAPNRLQPDVLPAARRLAAALLDWWRRPAAQQEQQLEAAQAAAARSCAYLRCANLGGGGRPAAGQGEGSQRCSACRAVWYCGTACSHADWRAGHRRVCKALGAARAAEKAARRQAAAEAAAAVEEGARQQQ